MAKKSKSSGSIPGEGETSGTVQALTILLAVSVLFLVASLIRPISELKGTVSAFGIVVRQESVHPNGKYNEGGVVTVEVTEPAALAGTYSVVAEAFVPNVGDLVFLRINPKHRGDAHLMDLGGSWFYVLIGLLSTIVWSFLLFINSPSRPPRRISRKRK